MQYYLIPILAQANRIQRRLGMRGMGTQMTNTKRQIPNANQLIAALNLICEFKRRGEAARCGGSPRCSDYRALHDSG